MKFESKPVSLPGPMHIVPQLFEDDRGYFFESYNQKDFKQLGIEDVFVQDNQSRSVKGTLRGLHFQKQHPQAKLARVLSGKVFDVAVDLRTGSKTLGNWTGVILDSESHNMFYIPVGFAHGFLTLSDHAVFAYKCSDFYNHSDEGGLLWSDPDIGIKWPLDDIGTPQLSTKDQQYPLLRDLKFRFEENQILS